MITLNKILKEYKLPVDMYVSLKQSLSVKCNRDFEEMHSFLEEIPHKMRIDISVFIFNKNYRNIVFLKNKSRSFIAWICPLLKPLIISQHQNVYFEGDEITCIYFVRKGSCDFVLSKHANCKYINITEGQEFGTMDIVGSALGNGIKLEEWVFFKDKMKR